MSDFRFTRPNNFPPIIKNLIIINVLLWIVQLMFDQGGDAFSRKIGLWPIESQNFEPYQIITHMFAHATYVGTPENSQIAFYHIIFNMFNLWMFGKILENVWGSKRFLIFYLACGLGSAIAHMTVQYFEYKEVLTAIDQANRLGMTDLAQRIAENGGGYVVGASGAVMGVMVGFAVLFPNTELSLLFFPIPIKAKWIILALVAIDLFAGINPWQGDNVAHFAHLGGALTGFIIVYIWNKTNRRTFY
jgi:membrane associated rhomboid family serine protease